MAEDKTCFQSETSVNYGKPQFGVGFNFASEIADRKAAVSWSRAETSRAALRIKIHTRSGDKTSGDGRVLDLMMIEIPKKRNLKIANERSTTPETP